MKAVPHRVDRIRSRSRASVLRTGFALNCFGAPCCPILLSLPKECPFSLRWSGQQSLPFSASPLPFCVRSGDGAQAHSPCTLWLLHLSYYLFFFTPHQATRLYRARKCVCTQSCPALRNPMDFSPPVFFVHGIFQEWVAISFTRRSSLTRDRICISRVFCIGRWIFYQVAQLVKNLHATQKTWVRSLGWEDPLKKEMATHSSILAWQIPMDRKAWQATVHGIAKSWTHLSS